MIAGKCEAKGRAIFFALWSINKFQSNFETPESWAWRENFLFSKKKIAINQLAQINFYSVPQSTDNR
jgi:hypothetical protein